MSSFVIGKEEYIKAAGIVAGIAEAYKNYIHGFWFWDYESNQNSTPEDFYRHFAEFHTMNALSVQEQYEDEEAEIDGNEYRDTFNTYLRKGKSATMEAGKMREVFLNLRKFFRSCEYQTEKEAYSWKMKMYFNALLNEIVGYVLPGESESWGTLEL